MATSGHVRQYAALALIALAAFLLDSAVSFDTGSAHAQNGQFADQAATQIVDDAPCLKFAAPQSRKQGCKRGGVTAASSTRLRDETDAPRPSRNEASNAHGRVVANRFAASDQLRLAAFDPGRRGAPFWDAFSRTSSLLY